jgi:D-glucuronyl C5-epimerase C-terminus
MRAPWFSGMAEGQALSLLTRLYQVTGEQKWRDAAAATFNSFRNAPAQNLPSTVNVDPANYLWLEEYPRWPTTSSDRTFNGHMYSAFGLYDYYRMSEDPAANAAWNGALANTRYYFSHGFRTPGFTSHYCLVHPAAQPTSYHQGHWTQLLSLHAQSADPIFSRYADLLRADYPPPAVSGTAQFVSGRHTGHKYNAAGAITASKTINLVRQSSAPANARQRIKGRGVMLRITAGSLAGYWIPESYLHVWLAGSKVSLTYPRPRTVVIPAGSWSAYRYNTAGKRIAWRTIHPPRTTSAPFDASAVINGRWHLRVTAGSLAGYWLPAAGTTQN